MRAEELCQKHPAIKLLHLLSIRVLQFVSSLWIDKPCLRSLAMKIPTNEMQFTDRKKFFTDRISLLRSVRSVPIEKPYMSTLVMKILMRCTNEMQFTDRKRPFTDCMAYLNPYGPYGS